MMQNIEQESPIDRNLMRCPHAGVACSATCNL
jgi:hypothetical protein